MDLRQLRYFISIVDAGSFTRAAELLAVAQPALSRQVRDLEDELGVRLLHRNGRGVVPTDAGRELAVRARRVVEDVERIKVDLTRDRGRIGGTVVVAAPPTVCQPLGVDLISAVTSAYPDVRLHLVEGMSAHVHEWLASGRSDLAVLYASQSRRPAAAEPLATDHLHLLVPAAWRFREPGTRVALVEVAGLPLVLSGRPHGLRRLVDAAAAAAGVELCCEVEVDAFGAIRDLVVGGRTATLQPLTAFLREVEQGLVVAHPVVRPRIPRTLVLATPTTRPVSAATHAVADILRTEMRRLVLRAEGAFGADAEGE